jgi:hypothetical protein
MSTTPSPGGAAQTGIVRCRKTVTPKKLEANRLNAKSSTGPRTDRGKKNSRFNALTLGLFAKHVVTPICDGYKPEKDFKSLLDGLQPGIPADSGRAGLRRIAMCIWRVVGPGC